MTRFLCHLGIHKPIWRPAYDPGSTTWLRIRSCQNCGLTLRRHPWWTP